MTNEQNDKLYIVFNSLKDDEKNLELLHLPYNDEYRKILHDKEIIAVEVSDTIRNRSMFTAYSGVINLLRVTKNEIILRPNLIKELLTNRI